MREHVEIGPYTPHQIEAIYQEIMASGYYDASYNADDWKPEPYRLMANILKDVFFKDAPAAVAKPTMIKRLFGATASTQSTPAPKVIDLGCGVGFLVKFLRQVGLDAKGIEFSDGIYQRVDQATKEHVRLEAPETFYGENQFRDTKLMVALEVFEHLPLTLLQKNLSKIAKELDGYVFLTIPSSGVDPWTGRTGFVEQSPYRLADMRKNALFSYLAMLDGKPGGGHITLASFRWWTDFFLINGFARIFDFESKLKDYDGIFESYRWCPYVLRRLDTGTLRFGQGWKSSGDEHGPMLMTGGESQIEFNTSTPCDLTLKFEQLDPNRNLDGRLFWSVDELIMDAETATIDYVKRASGIYNSVDENGSKGLVISLDSPLGKTRPQRTYRVKLFSPEVKVLGGQFKNQVGGQILSEAHLKSVG